MYYDYNEAVKYIKPHRILALNRGENEKVLNVSIDVDKDGVLSFLEKKLIKNATKRHCKRSVFLVLYYKLKYNN